MMSVTAALFFALSQMSAAPPDFPEMEVHLGENAYALQQRTGFPMGYQTSPDGLSPIGGDALVGDARIQIGPVKLRCQNAFLALIRTADMVTGQSIVCPASDPVGQIEMTRDVIDDAWDWSDRRDLMASPRRAREFGHSITDAIAYAARTQPMGNLIDRVPLYNWASDEGLFIEMAVARHRALGYAMSYEVNFDWRTDCLITAEASTTIGDDARRADDMTRRLDQLCPDIPAAFRPRSEE